MPEWETEYKISQTCGGRSSDATSRHLCRRKAGCRATGEGVKLKCKNPVFRNEMVEGGIHETSDCKLVLLRTDGGIYVRFT